MNIVFKDRNQSFFHDTFSYRKHSVDKPFHADAHEHRFNSKIIGRPVDRSVRLLASYMYIYLIILLHLMNVCGRNCKTILMKGI